MYIITSYHLVHLVEQTVEQTGESVQILVIIRIEKAKGSLTKNKNSRRNGKRLTENEITLSSVHPTLHLAISGPIVHPS